MNPVVAVLLMIVVAVAGIGVGYLSGVSNLGNQTTTTFTTSETELQSTTMTSTQTTTEILTTTSIATNTSNLVNYWSQAYASTWQYFQISRIQLVSLLNAGNSSVYIIDVRQQNGTAGYVTGHIAGSHNIPFQNMSTAVASNLIPQNRIIIDVCYTGQTGAMTTAILRELGYDAYNLSGGMAGWNNATRISAGSPIAVGENYPIVNGTSQGAWTIFNP